MLRLRSIFIYDLIAGLSLGLGLRWCGSWPWRSGRRAWSLRLRLLRHRPWSLRLWLHRLLPWLRRWLRVVPRWLCRLRPWRNWFRLWRLWHGPVHIPLIRPAVVFLLCRLRLCYRGNVCTHRICMATLRYIFSKWRCARLSCVHRLGCFFYRLRSANYIWWGWALAVTRCCWPYLRRPVHFHRVVVHSGSAARAISQLIHLYRLA